MAGWFLPAIGYALILGAGGVTAKLALRTITWEQLVLWVPIAYIFFSAIFIIFNGTRLPVGVGGAWAAATAFAASSALILFFYALTKGPASQVTPVTSAYPVVTVIVTGFSGPADEQVRDIGEAAKPVFDEAHTQPGMAQLRVVIRSIVNRWRHAHDPGELTRLQRWMAPLVGFLNNAIISRSHDAREFARSLAG